MFFVFSSCKNQNIPFDPAKTRFEQWTEDIAYFESEFIDKAKTYTETSRKSAKILLSDIVKQMDSLSDFQIQLKLSEAVVLANNGHTTLSLPKQKKIPLRFYRFSDGVHVVKTTQEYSKFLGAKLINLNSIPVEQLEALLFPYVSGIEPWKKFKTINMITAPTLLHELGLGKKDSITLRLESDIGTSEVTIGSQKVEGDRSWFESWANLYPTLGSENKWNFLKKNIKELPMYLGNAEKGVYYTFDAEVKIAYFQITSFWQKCPNIKEKVETFHSILQTKSDYDVVFDLRFYTGGDYGVFTKLAKKTPKYLNATKKIFLVLSEKTYSAGIVTASRVKHFSGDKLVVVGQPVGDRLKFWAESKPITLPNSKIKIHSAQKEHDWENNKRSLSKTHLANFLYGVAAQNLEVDQKIGLTYRQYMENKDPIWEWIVTQSQMATIEN